MFAGRTPSDVKAAESSAFPDIRVRTGYKMFNMQVIEAQILKNLRGKGKSLTNGLRAKKLSQVFAGVLALLKLGNLQSRDFFKRLQHLQKTSLSMKQMVN